MPGFLRKFAVFLVLIFGGVFATTGVFANTITLDDFDATTPSSPTSLTSSSTSITIPTKTGYVYGGHYYHPNCDGTHVINASGTVVGSAPTFDTTLYACWTPAYYKVTVNGNGANASPSATPAGNNSLYLKYGVGWYQGNTASAVQLTSFSSIAYKNGYRLRGYWTDNSCGGNGGVQVVDGGGTYLMTNEALHSLTAAGTIYACWVSDASWSVVTLDGMGADTASSPTTLYKNLVNNAGRCNGLRSNGGCGATTTIITSVTVPTKANYTFGGYYTLPDGGGTMVIGSDGSVVDTDPIDSVSPRLYAKWIPNVYAVSIENATPATVYLKYGVGWFSKAW